MSLSAEKGTFPSVTLNFTLTYDLDLQTWSRSGQDEPRSCQMSTSTVISSDSGLQTHTRTRTRTHAHTRARTHAADSGSWRGLSAIAERRVLVTVLVRIEEIQRRQRLPNAVETLALTTKKMHKDSVNRGCLVSYFLSRSTAFQNLCRYCWLLPLFTCIFSAFVRWYSGEFALHIVCCG